jgi:hypothetical protein
MTGLNKLSEKEKRAQRRRNHIAKDLGTPKYRQRIVERKRVDGEEGSFFADRYYEDEVDW